MMEQLKKGIVTEIPEYDEDGKFVKMIPNPNYNLVLNARLRKLRKTECFVYVNRGQLWYDTVSESQKEELHTWYQGWLDVTDTHVIPTKPEWLV